MQNLLGDRFLKRFIGEIRRKQKHVPSVIEGYTPDAAEEMSTRPNNNAGEEDSRKTNMDSLETGPGSTENTSEVNNG